MIRYFQISSRERRLIGMVLQCKKLGIRNLEFGIVRRAPLEGTGFLYFGLLDARFSVLDV
jgi:hypothetical protein